MSDEIESRRLLVPSEIVPELRAGGYLRSVAEGIVKGGADVGLLVLTVYNTSASTVTLLQTPGVIRALAVSLVRWYQGEKSKETKRPFELTATGPNGHVDFSNDVPPDPEMLAEFLRDNIWGSNAPADREEDK